MKGWIAFLLFLGSSTCAQAATFTPDSALFQTELDGAWELPAATFIEEPLVAREEVFSLGFEEVIGEGSVEVGEEFIRINTLENPKYLVNNRARWDFEIKGKIWLEMEYRVWSSETERGFDEPVLAVYHNQDLIYREDANNQCLAEACPRKKKRWYRGETNGEQSVVIFAGDMGDREKASGVDIFSVTVYRAKDDVPMEPETIQVSSSSSTIMNTHTYLPAEVQIAKKYVAMPLEIREAGEEVLGAVDQPIQQEEEEQNAEERETSFPWLILVAGALGSLGIGIFFWRKASV